MHNGYKIHRCCYNNLRSRRRPPTAWMPGCHHPWTRLAQIRLDQHTVVPLWTLGWDQHAAESNPLGAKKISNIESNRIWWQHGLDRWHWGGARERRHQGREDWWPQQFWWQRLQIWSALRREARMGSTPPPRPPSPSRRRLCFLHAATVDTFMSSWRGRGYTSVGCGPGWRWFRMVAWPGKP
jgi:hypothetical protein